MPKRHEVSRKRVAEPVQVYLDQTDRARLDRLTRALSTTKSDVLRSALQALEGQLRRPDEHPVLGLIGIATDETVPAAGYDVAREHDRYFADLEDNRRAPRGRETKRTPRRKTRGP